MQNNSKASIKEVKEFWNKNPLFKGESKKKISTKSFFKDHDNTIINKIFFGKKNILNKILFPKNVDQNKQLKVLDLGCGIGFWLSFMEKNFNYKLIGSDISENSIKIAKKRVSSNIKFNLQFSEKINFKNFFFDHINCQGVLHHTPKPQILLSEIWRTLVNEGTCSISVYYENFLIRNYNFFYFFLNILSFIFKNLGRDRDFNNLPKKKSDLIRIYDGKKNPIGYSLSKKEIIELVNKAGFEIINYKFYFFPSRFLKIKLPNFINSILAEILPFMIILNLKKNRKRKKFH